MFFDMSLKLESIFWENGKIKKSLNYKLVDSLILNYECYDLIQTSQFF